ncbi:MAG: nuclear transport factor 2 family protein [Halothiobacillus sp.]|nr:nuclear transport factor 2 family protein [Halothiobacillus sp.]
MATRPSIRRTGNGTIDSGYYERRARALRSRFMRVWLRNLLCQLARLWQRRTKEAELNALDDRALHDIGISRSDIPAIASGLYFLDKSRRLRGRAVCLALEEKSCSDRFFNLHPINDRKGKATMTSQNTHNLRQFAESWIAAWNAHDLDAVLAHFCEDLEFSSPLIKQFANEPSGKLIGKNAVRAYWKNGLSRTPDLHFELVDVLAGVDCLTILYRGHRGLSAEVFQLDGDGHAIRGQALYSV